MSEKPLEKGPQFEAMMSEIDHKLINEGVDIPARPLSAMREVSIRYNISLPFGGNPERLPPEQRQYAALSEAINQWYEHNYGDRLKVNPCPGQTVVLLDGDLYVLRVPRIYGTVTFTLSRARLNKPGISSRGPVICNILQLVNEMTPSKAARLSDLSLRTLSEAFETAVPAIYTLASTHHKLTSIALGDIEVAVDRLMTQSDRYGESKWASLQAAEKVLKAAIELAGEQFRFTHGLADLCQTLSGTGLNFDARTQIAKIQCKAGIRYGDEPCTRDEALIAHQASLQLVNILREAGAKFSLGIGGWVTPS